jgi:hypothetical protein
MSDGLMSALCQKQAFRAAGETGVIRSPRRRATALTSERLGQESLQF